MGHAFVIAIVGAECTGKSTLAQALCAALLARGEHVALVSETLREFCDREGRTPRHEEQAALAEEQTRRIREAARGHRVVVADTTALMTAVYSHRLFDDDRLYAPALRAQRDCDLTLLTALDLPWVADGVQRDGEHVRRPVDDAVRAALQRGGVAYSVVGGAGAQRLAAARAALQAARSARIPDRATVRWQHVCERCGDPACEAHLLARR